MSEGLLFALIARIPAEGVSAFEAYERQVLPLLAEHGGVLQRRLRAEGGGAELHLVWFPSEAAYDAYRNDPRRIALATLIAASKADTELLRVRDV